MVADSLIHYEYITEIITLFLFLYYRGKSKTPLALYRVYYWMLGVTFMISFFDVLISDMLIKADKVNRGLLTVTAGVYYLLIISIAPVCTIFVLYLTGITYSHHKKWKMLLFLPYFLMAAVIITSQFTGIIYRIGDSNELIICKFFYIMYIYLAYYGLLWFYIAGVYYETVGKKQVFQFFVYPIFIATMMVMGKIIYNEMIFSFPLALCLIMVVLMIKNPEEVYDKSNALMKKYLVRDISNDCQMKKPFCLYVIKIKEIKMLNDSFGEDIVDVFLRPIVQYLAHIYHDSAIYRLTTDIFVLKMYLPKDDDSHKYAEIILDKFKHKWKNADMDVRLPISITILDFPNDFENKEDMYYTLNGVFKTDSDVDKIYTAEDYNKEDKEAEIIEAVKKAVEKKSFQVYYQPIYSADKKHIMAAEALVRLIDDKLGFISPEIFIPLAEREGYILKIGKFVFNEVCKFYSENNLEEKGIEYIEVNLSAVQCMQYLLAEEFCEIMERWNIRPDQINFEITETSAMTTNAAVGMNLGYFSNKGIELSLDDYGTGYSNLSYMYNLPFSIVKIDKSILWAADKNEKADVVLRNIFQMTKKMGLKIVVEGIETQDHVEKMMEMQCDYFQGYYFSKPIPGKSFVEYITNFQLPDVCKGVN